MGAKLGGSGIKRVEGELGLSTAAKAGIGVGVAVAVIVLVAAVVLVIWRKNGAVYDVNAAQPKVFYELYDHGSWEGSAQETWANPVEAPAAPVKA